MQLRKAIEEVNSGTLTTNTVNSEPVTEKQPMTPEEEMLLNNNVHNTVSSMESTISNSDNCSDVELGNIRIENKGETK